jgi:hypothetical protein
MTAVSTGPFRRALRLARFFPAAVRGPLLFLALRRFAAICFLVMVTPLDF